MSEPAKLLDPRILRKKRFRKLATSLSVLAWRELRKGPQEASSETTNAVVFSRAVQVTKTRKPDEPRIDSWDFLERFEHQGVYRPPFIRSFKGF